MGWQAEKIVKHGNHMYAVCPHCRGLIKITGWFRGAHLCSGRGH